MSAFSKGRAGAFSERWVGPALTVVLLYAGCATGAQFPPAFGPVEFYLNFVDQNFLYGTYEFAWVATCQEGCAGEPASVSCKATFDRVDLIINAAAPAHVGVVVLPAFPLADPDVSCLPPLTSEPHQGVWQYQLVVKGGVAGELIFNSSCVAEIFVFGGVIQHTELAYGESSNHCAPELGGT